MLRLSLRRSGSSIVKVEELADPEELSLAAAMVDFPLIKVQIIHRRLVKIMMSIDGIKKASTPPKGYLAYCQ